ncbi:hypothetical protein SLEP1_g16391 [Rubroshorea leprosula]|uniref:Peptidase S26 domain-containing protein n=1 Tax=Rubroshorea leprosula TaxID=152421 RepID=A0AAV5IZS7_9ROSI|nr:hypothetical protein SLEP1_g16391 [Rubroshorea leprosula]
MRQWISAAKEVLERASTVAKFLCWIHVTDSYLLSSTVVQGASMLPTLNFAGDVVLTEHISQRLGKVGRGDLVLVRSPIDPNKILTKRIVGMEGDTVTFFADPHLGDYTISREVPKGHIWIQGDNMYQSRDSRHFGPLPYGLIQGKVFFRVWPPHAFGSLS